MLRSCYLQVAPQTYIPRAGAIIRCRQAPTKRAVSSGNPSTAWHVSAAVQADTNELCILANERTLSPLIGSTIKLNRRSSRCETGVSAINLESQATQCAGAAGKQHPSMFATET